MSLYTRTGDTGLASTKNRLKMEKSSPIFSLLGALEEFTSALGMCRQKLRPPVTEIVCRLQEDTAALMEEISGGKRFADPERIRGLEQAIDSVMAAIPESASSIPGTSQAGAQLDLARAVARRAEREAVALSRRSGLSRDVLTWLNRVSDLVYALARMTDLLEQPASQPAPLAEPAARVRSGGEAESVPHFLSAAMELCQAVLRQARQEGVKAVVAVCDRGGTPVCLLREDDAFLASVDIALNKAFTSVSLKMSTKELGELSQPGASLYGVQFTNGGKIVIFGGGVPLRDREGTICGGFGVSGGTAEQDSGLAEFAQTYFSQRLQAR